MDKDRVTSLTDELEDIVDSDIDSERCLKLGKGLSLKVKSQLTDFLKANLDVFTWNHEDMVGIDPNVMLHRLNINPEHKHYVRQKRRPMTAECYAALKEEVDKLLANKFIRKASYPTWVAKPVLVKKKNGK